MRASSLLSLPRSWLVLVPTLAAVAACSSSSSPERAGDAAGSAAVAVATSGTRLRAKYIVAADVRQLVGFHDTLRDEDCSFQEAGDGTLRCVPLTAHRSLRLSGAPDATCTTTVEAALVPACEARAYALLGSGACPQPQKLEEVRSVVGAEPLFTGGAGNCAVSSPAQNAGSVVRALGPALAWTDFAEATAVDEPAGDVVRTVAVAADGARQVVGQRLAAHPDVKCTYRADTEGRALCVPVARSGPVLYSDSTCSTPSFVEDSTLYSGSCEALSAYWVEPATQQSACAAVRAVHALDDGEVTSGYAKEEASESSAGSCYSRSYVYSDIARHIAANVTAELPRTSRVGAGVVGARLVPALVLHRGDGEELADLVPGFYDRQLGTECLFGPASDGTLRCIPLGATAALFHDGPGCTSPKLVASLTADGCSVGERPFARTTSQTCPPTVTAYRLTKTTESYSGLSTEIAPGRCAGVGTVVNGFDAVAMAPSELALGTLFTE